MDRSICHPSQPLRTTAVYYVRHKFVSATVY
jgi:hypothetical protein